MIDEIEDLEISNLDIGDYEELKSVMIESYVGLKDNYWKREQIAILLNQFSEGQVVVKINGKIVGCALAIIVDYEQFRHRHNYAQITANGSFTTHHNDGDTLYGIDIFVKPEYRGLRLGRRLYDYRKELCERLNLKGIAFGGRIPNYHKYADNISPREYIQRVKNKEIHDPVFNFQISNDFHPAKIIKNYLRDDSESSDYAILLEWDNIYYEKNDSPIQHKKKSVRLGLIQWQMRPYKTVDDVIQQAEYFIDVVSGYRCDFVLFPEYFNAPLMASDNHLEESQAIRNLSEYTHVLRQKFMEFAISYNINIIAGSMPELVNNSLYNVGYLCKRDGKQERYEKIHVTPDEVRLWGLKGGNKLNVFDTDCGKIGILICYDIEFPELSRLLASQEMDILFVPFLTDTQNAYSRVRHCAQARAIENECYVAISGCVGNLPNVENMDIQYSNSTVFTPCDFAFPTNGIKAESTPNTEMVLIVDVEIDLLRELNKHGSVRNLHDRRLDLYNLTFQNLLAN